MKRLWRKCAPPFLTATLWRGSTVANYILSLQRTFPIQEQCPVLKYSSPQKLQSQLYQTYLSSAFMLKNFLGVIFVTKWSYSWNPYHFPQKRWCSLGLLLSFCDTPLAIPRVCQQNKTRQLLPTAGTYQFSQQPSYPAADKKNKQLPKKMTADAKMSHWFPVKIPF